MASVSRESSIVESGDRIMGNRLNRRQFLEAVGTGTAGLVLPLGRVFGAQGSATDRAVKLPAEWLNPPSEFSQAPFWFWNDDLSNRNCFGKSRISGRTASMAF